MKVSIFPATRFIFNKYRRVICCWRCPTILFFEKSQNFFATLKHKILYFSLQECWRNGIVTGPFLFRQTRYINHNCLRFFKYVSRIMFMGSALSFSCLTWILSVELWFLPQNYILKKHAISTSKAHDHLLHEAIYNYVWVLVLWTLYPRFGCNKSFYIIIRRGELLKATLLTEMTLKGGKIKSSLFWRMFSSTVKLLWSVQVSFRVSNWTVQSTYILVWWVFLTI